ncbi:aminotransferase class IV [Azospirillum agricola]|uniref:aminotransferase class IV n=1 Tax=Azospirillum agricola TaxID=1720247 RepID=UPI000A0EF75F|nr:aminotransferase class IV [Azospirillum agricola]SMH61631.1 branched-chain amino acid aminotransferase [Azospirillum lipoferum]
MQLTGKGAQTPQDDHRNDGVLIWLNGRLVTRARATVSIFDAGFGLGDGVWEGVRYTDGRFVFLDDHLDRLEAGAKAIALDIGLSRDGLREALQQTIDANGMTDGVHIRLMVTRGEKSTIHQDPRNALGRPTIAIVAEHKLPDPQVKRDGLVLATTPVRCSPPDMFDMRLNSHSRLNLIQALLPAIAAGAQEALMLDPHGFVSSCNSTNLFFVSGGAVLTSTGRYCFNGITRRKVLDLCAAHGIPVRQTDFTLAEAYASEEAFVTGTFGGITPVSRLDGRAIGGSGRPVTERLSALYEALTRAP